MNVQPWRNRLRLAKAYWPFFAFFIFGNLVFVHEGGPNVLSRLATLAAMTENHSFRIDDYESPNPEWTEDWARGPNNHYYSNKAPGSAWLAFPFYWILDRFITRGLESPAERNGTRLEDRNIYSLWLSFWLQILPLSLLALFGLELVQGWHLPKASESFFLVALFFGNTASLYANIYAGHALTAALVLAVLFALLRRRYFWLGFFLGFSILTDYASATLLIPVLVITGANLARRPSEILTGFVGALPALCLWGIYHVSCFGGFFRIANRFTNPVFVDVGHEKYNLWGILTLPRWGTLRGLLFGSERGVLVTQPWIMVILFLMPWFWRPATRQNRPEEETIFFSLAGLTLAVALIASFGGWHGGFAPGPRYLSGFLPPFALCGAILMRGLNRGRILLGATLAVSVVFTLFVYKTGTLVSFQPLWTSFFREFAK